MIIAKYKGGSSVILPNPHDTDIIVYCESEKEKIKLLAKCKDHSVDYHFTPIDQATRLFIGSYSYKYMELIEGKDIGLDKYDVCDHAQDYAKLLLKLIAMFQRHDDLKNKRWYHIYLGYYTLKNGKGKNLTKAQKEKAQEIHDEGISKTLVKNIIDYLTNIVNNKIEESN